MKRAVCIAAALLGAASAQAATQVLVVAGIGGEAQYDERFAQWSQTMAGAAVTATGDKETVVRLDAHCAQPGGGRPVHADAGGPWQFRRQ